MENTQKNTQIRRRSSTKVRSMAQVGMLAAVATVLMLFEFPLPFVPSFYKLDISEIPVLLGTFAMGPVAGVMTECIKILLNFVINGTTTGGVGEIANFLIGCSLFFLFIRIGSFLTVRALLYGFLRCILLSRCCFIRIFTFIHRSYTNNSNPGSAYDKKKRHHDPC